VIYQCNPVLALTSGAEKAAKSAPWSSLDSNMDGVVIKFNLSQDDVAVALTKHYKVLRR